MPTRIDRIARVVQIRNIHHVYFTENRTSGNPIALPNGSAREGTRQGFAMGAAGIGGAWGRETPRPFAPGSAVPADWGVSTQRL